ncbi:MAG: hypothetical protein H6609_16355 [Ignavibacteriales bacterium]|nr:hypothetical protein [Ignavibacteriales bacterium]
MNFIELYNILFFAGLIITTLFIFSSVSLKYYPNSFFPKLAKKMRYLIALSIEMNNFIFYGLWAILSAMFLYFELLNTDIFLIKSMSVIVTSLNFVMVLILLEFIRLKKESLYETIEIEKSNYIFFSLILFQFCILKPNLLDEIIMYSNFL